MAKPPFFRSDHSKLFEESLRREKARKKAKARARARTNGHGRSNGPSYYARATDPDTSHDAVPTAAERKIQRLRVLRIYDDGVARTDHDAYHLAGMIEHINGARQRCTELRQREWIVRLEDEYGEYIRGPTPSGRTGCLCAITQAGRDALKEHEGTET